MRNQKYPILQKLRANQTMTAGAFWSDCFIKAISCFCSIIVMLILLSVILPFSTERINQIAGYVSIVLAILWCIPIARNTRYRLRDAGYGPKAYLWLLLPVIGWIIFIAVLCAKSLPRKADGTFL